MSIPRGDSGSINISIPKYDKLVKNLHAINKDAETVVKRTVSDFKSRAPAWIAQAVVEVYAIEGGGNKGKQSVKAAFTGVKKGVGRVKVAGTTVDNMGLVYSGRTLTPKHFKMKSASPTFKKGTPYQKPISAEIYKGQRKVLASDAFLGTNNGGGYIPFQRTSEARYPIKSIKTLSVPQMIGNESVAGKIQQNIEEGLGKRVEHHLNQELNRRG